MRRPVKGEEGYIAAARVKRAVITALFLAAVFFVFFFARAYFGTNRNVFSILAAIGALPTANSAVNLVMLFRAKGCSPQAAAWIREVSGDLPGNYDLYLTAYDRGYALSHTAAGQNRICAFTEDPAMNCASCSSHIREVLAGSGYRKIDVEVTSDLEKYLELLRQLREQGAEDRDEQEALLSHLRAAAL